MDKDLDDLRKRAGLVENEAEFSLRDMGEQLVTMGHGDNARVHVFEIHDRDSWGLPVVIVHGERNRGLAQQILGIMNRGV